MSAQQKKHPFDFKTQYGLGFNPQDDEIVVDFFCGGGGAGIGLEMGLGRAVNVAKNHSHQAISMHTMNHPGAKHFTTDVFDGDPDTECGGTSKVAGCSPVFVNTHASRWLPMGAGEEC